MSSIEQRSIKRSMNPSQGSDDRTTARESLMLWSLNLVLKATVRGARDSRVTLLIGLCWHQARPTSTKAAVAHFSPPGPAGPGVHKHFHPLRAGPPGRMITLMDVAVLKFLAAHVEAGHSGLMGLRRHYLAAPDTDPSTGPTCTDRSPRPARLTRLRPAVLAA